jgi:hypothetical protein
MFEADVENLGTTGLEHVLDGSISLSLVVAELAFVDKVHADNAVVGIVHLLQDGNRRRGLSGVKRIAPPLHSLYNKTEKKNDVLNCTSCSLYRTGLGQRSKVL